MQEMMPQIGRLLVGAGVALVIIGLLFMYAKTLHLGQLPDDITVAGKGWQATILLGTSLLLSVLFTIALNLLFRRR
jgi:hypothetical protein